MTCMLCDELRLKNGIALGVNRFELPLLFGLTGTGGGGRVVPPLDAVPGLLSGVADWGKEGDWKYPSVAVGISGLITGGLHTGPWC